MARASHGAHLTSSTHAPAPGSDARTPGRIPARGWLTILRRVGRHLMGEQFPLLSAGIAFFAVLSIAPVLVTALSVYGALNTPEQAMQQLSDVVEVLPPQLESVAADQLTSITNASTQVLTVRGLTGLLIALWTATTAMTYLLDTLTLAYREEESRSLLRRSTLGLGFVVAGALSLGGLITATGVVSRTVEGAPDVVRLLLQALLGVAMAVLMAVALAVLYRFAPDRKGRARWRWINWGAVAATALWLGTSFGLFAYVQRLGSYERTYGSLAGVAISMFWLWLTVLLVIAGASMNAEAERQTTRDSTVGPEQPLGERGAVVADSAPPFLDEEEAPSRGP